MLPTLSVFESIRQFFSALESLSKNSDSELNQTKHLQLRLLNYLGISFALVFSMVLFLVTFFVNIPFTFIESAKEEPDYQSQWFYRWLLFYIYINFLCNYALMRYGATRSIYSSPNELPYHSITSREDWKKCKRCDQVVPARTHHCPLCDMCVLKRDHHCFFVGCCIGFYNQRYFICCAFHTLWFSAVSFYFMINYLSAHYVTFLGVEFFKYFLPYALIVWVFGHTTFVIFLHILVFYLTFTALIAAIFFLLWQCVLVKNGQTSYELVKGKKTYQSGIMTHIRSVFGPFWVLNFIFPMPWFANEGDGRNWGPGSTKFM